MAKRIAPTKSLEKPPKKEKKPKRWLKRSGKTIPKVGKKTRAWNNARRKVSKEHIEKQRTRCENCQTEFGLTNAHRFKRKDIPPGSIELFKTVKLCVPCHDYADNVLNPRQMKRFLDKLIRTRLDRYWEPC